MNKPILTLAVALALAAVPPALAAAAHDTPHGHGTPKITLDQGRKWATDAPLRQGMDAIRVELATNLPAIRGNGLQSADYRALGENLESQVGFIVGNCKLPPQADANLHVIMAELLAAADELKWADTRKARTAAMRAVKAANTYGKYFDHPQWRPLSPTAQAALDLGDAAALIARTFPGRVIAAQSDATGGEALHHHVDLLLPHGAVVKLDVDARTGRIANRGVPEETPASVMPLTEALLKVKRQARGEVVAAHFDPDPSPHYHVNVRVSGSELKRYQVDAETGALTPR
jgi:uncharacterized membrane protein YkoI